MDIDFTNWDKIIGLTRIDVRECAISQTKAVQTNEWRGGYEVSNEWLGERIDKLWVHCKNTEAVIELYKMDEGINFFWHQEDLLTITSAGYLWVYPGNQPLDNTISVLPELYNEDVSKCIGICSDYILDYQKKLQ